MLGLAAHGLVMDGRWRVEGDYTEAGGYAAACELAALRPEERPTAMLVGNLMMGLGVLRAFRESGISIPGDISVIVLDEHPMAAYSDPSLTTVRMPLREMGMAATRMLIGAIAGEPLSRVIITDPPPTLIRRESAGPGPFLGS
jgi:DNA-binding LacI/PurR family transcriptional regulator